MKNLNFVMMRRYFKIFYHLHTQMYVAFKKLIAPRLI